MKHKQIDIDVLTALDNLRIASERVIREATEHTHPFGNNGFKLEGTLVPSGAMMQLHDALSALKDIHIIDKEIT